MTQIRFVTNQKDRFPGPVIARQMTHQSLAVTLYGQRANNLQDGSFPATAALAGPPIINGRQNLNHNTGPCLKPFGGAGSESGQNETHAPPCPLRSSLPFG